MVNIIKSINEAVVLQHAHGGAFKWLLRDRAVGAPHYNLKDLNKLDSTVEAHLDGLRIAGDKGFEICIEQLGLEGPGEAFIASCLAFESGQKERIEPVLEATAKPEIGRGVISALCWLGFDRAKPYLSAFIKGQQPLLQWIGLGAAGGLRVDSRSAVYNYLQSETPIVRARAYKMAGELGYLDLCSEIQTGLRHPEEFVRFWAAWSLALLGQTDCIVVLRSLVEAGSPFADRAADIGVRRMNPIEAKQWFGTLSSDLKTQRIACKVASAILDPELMPQILAAMKNPEAARAAGEAFTFITGIDISYHDLETDRPADFQSGPTDNPEDENVEMDPDDDLPWPDPTKIGDWWKQNRGSYVSNKRYFLGKHLDASVIMDALKNARQRQRAAAALEMAFQKPGQILFEVRGRGEKQIF